MDVLFQKAKINDAQLKSHITKIVAHNLSSLSEPCYFPDVKKNFYELLMLTGLSEQDVKQFSKRRWAGKKEEKFPINMDHIANFYVFIMQYFLRKNDTQSYMYTMVLFNIRYYSNLMHKHFKFCNQNLFKYALEVLTKTHLFYREKTIANAIFFMSKEMIKKWTKALKSNDLDKIGEFMRETRHRISQSVKSFAQTYYKAFENGEGIQTKELPTDAEGENQPKEEESNSNRLIDGIVQKITVYKFIDKKAYEKAKRLTKINTNIASQIIFKLNSTKYSANLRLIYKLYLKEIKSEQLCGKDFNSYIRQLMALKRTKSKIFFKQQVNLLLGELIKDAELVETYTKLTLQTQFLISLFLGYYLVSIVRNGLCGKR